MNDAVAMEFANNWGDHSPPAGTAWLAARRELARRAFQARGFPTLFDEDWKYTDVRPIAARRFRAGGGAAVSPELMVAAAFPGTCELRFTNGSAADGGPHPKLPSGVVVVPMSRARESHRDLLSGHVSRYAEPDKHGFLALNTALPSDGVLIHVPDGVEVTLPISLLFASAAGAVPAGSCPRNLIILGRNAAATVIECYTGSADGEYLTNAVTEASLGDGARLDHHRLQQEGDHAFHVANLTVAQGRDSRLVSHAYSLGAALSRNEVDVRLAAPGAETVLRGLYIAGGRQHMDHHTRIDHAVPCTRSDEHYRGVLDGHGRAVFNGKVIVHKDAQKTDARQSNANLLLSDDAEVDTKPELEIYADDVKCSHGASIGRLDDDMLFYLRSRAIPAATARSLLIFAFADEVLRDVTFAPMRSRLEQRVLGRLPDAALLREFVQ
jgi:Fe-S cluster assembly protein SufD